MSVSPKNTRRGKGGKFSYEQLPSIVVTRLSSERARLLGEAVIPEVTSFEKLSSIAYEQGWMDKVSKA